MILIQSMKKTKKKVIKKLYLIKGTLLAMTPIILPVKNRAIIWPTMQIFARNICFMKTFLSSTKLPLVSFLGSAKLKYNSLTRSKCLKPKF